MIIQPGKGILPSVNPTQSNQGRPATASARTDTDRYFDKISISAKAGDDAFLMELKSKIFQEVRTATTTGTISALHRQYEEGEYRVDSAAIARKILLLEED